ncbi:uncharacterized protein LOC119833373 [Zerene cesonia]|uniref:uncharacterized protein LOC119833373 n=1 Tax=Zerene cesonia TaxID=33412 RepID=UPI0018E51917|nr:uncharacterized protein LOC119833373 [Zerene cesonia]
MISKSIYILVLCSFFSFIHAWKAHSINNGEEGTAAMTQNTYSNGWQMWQLPAWDWLGNIFQLGNGVGFENKAIINMGNDFYTSRVLNHYLKMIATRDIGIKMMTS